MIKLYGVGRTRWAKCVWLLDEMGVAYEKVEARPQSAEVKALNPFGKVPVLVDDDKIVYESTAILNYLADKHPDRGFMPAAGTIERAHVEQWQSVATLEFEQPAWTLTKQNIFSERASAAATALAHKDFHQVAATAEAIWPQGEFLVGDRLTVADITMGYTLNWLDSHGLMQDYTRMRQYLHGMRCRPKWPRILMGG